VPFPFAQEHHNSITCRVLNGFSMSSSGLKKATVVWCFLCSCTLIILTAFSIAFATVYASESITTTTKADPVTVATTTTTTKADPVTVAKTKTKAKAKATKAVLTYEMLQECIDRYTSQGSWQSGVWSSVRPLEEHCGFQFQSATNESTSPTAIAYRDFHRLPRAFRRFRVGFMGDSTTRSDLRGFEEVFHCPRTDLDENAVFQRKDKDGNYICRLGEQSIKLNKCGIPPMIEINNCTGVHWKYFYKVYPWTPLDAWYMSKKRQPSVFHRLDVLVISMGRWFRFYEPKGSLNVTRDMETFIVELRQVYPGIILYQSEYALHHALTTNVQNHVTCPHATCSDCEPGGAIDTRNEWECSQTVTNPRPQSDYEIRSVLERHQILYLDRWNISKSLPMEYFKLWYCHDGYHNQWDCDHHLHFVALQHLQLIANVINTLFHKNYTALP
jgi:hypothetical protein